jgi:hypothetical protein
MEKRRIMFFIEEKNAAAIVSGTRLVQMTIERRKSYLGMFIRSAGQPRRSCDPLQMDNPDRFNAPARIRGRIGVRDITQEEYS